MSEKGKAWKDFSDGMISVRAIPSYIDFSAGWEACAKSKDETIKILKEALDKAVKYINKCPCDPDIYPEQLIAWNEYKEALKQVEGEGR